MPNRTVYIRSDDLDAWDKVPNKSEWIHEGLSTGLVMIPAKAPSVLPGKQTEPDLFLYATKGTSTTTIIPQTTSVTGNKPVDFTADKSFDFCKHGNVKGMCKQGCK